MTDVERELPSRPEPKPAPEGPVEHEHEPTPPAVEAPPVEVPPVVEVPPAVEAPLRMQITIRPRAAPAPAAPAFTPVEATPAFTPVVDGPAFTPVDPSPPPIAINRPAPSSRRQVRVTAQAISPGTATSGSGDRGRNVRARVREAMRCPFCRDDVAQTGAVGCARRGCGALYHAECWRECSTSYGGCAVFGCGSKDATGVSRTAFLVRLLRLVLAAVLFPTRVLEAIRSEGEGVAAMRRALRSDADRSHHVMWTKDRPGARTGTARFMTYLTKLGVLAVAYALVAVILITFPMQTFSAAKVILLLLAVPMAMTLGLYFMTWPVALGLHWARAVLEGEFSALARAAIGGTVLDRMRLPGTKKKG